MYSFDDDVPARIDERGKELIEKAKRAIALDKSNPNRNSIIEAAMNEMYDHFASYSEDDLNNLNFQLEIFRVESLLRNEFLPIQTEPIYDKNYQGHMPSTIRDNNDGIKALDMIVHETRNYLSLSNNLQTDSLEKQCITSSFHLEDLCEKANLKFIHVGIGKDLATGMFHHFTIVRITPENGVPKNYIVDCTYRQFFTKAFSNPRRIGVARGPIKGCSIGSFMTLNEKRKKIAETILTKGYIEATPEVIKEYFDAIVYSGRDKKFYEEHGLDYMNPDDVTPEYSALFYMNKLLENELQHGKRNYSLFTLYRVAEDIIRPSGRRDYHE